MSKLSGKRSLITGSGTGIGREVALEFAREGAIVVFHYSTSGDGAHSAADECKKIGAQAFVFQADLGKVEDCFSLVDQSIEALGGLDILVNNAGITHKCDFLEATPDDFDRIYAVNMRAQYFCAQRAARQMLNQGSGVLLNMTSVHAFTAMPMHSIYAGTKGAICAWTRELAIELAPKIRVNAIAPGWIEVPRHHETPGYDPNHARTQVPMGRVGTPLEVARACVYMASDDAAYMTGHVLLLDGGTTAWMSLAAARSSTSHR